MLHFMSVFFSILFYLYLANSFPDRGNSFPDNNILIQKYIKKLKMETKIENDREVN